MRFLFLLAVALPTCWAQFDSAVILGTIRDQRGGVLSGATVTVKNKQTGLTAVAKTDEKGDYLFPTVKIGSYQLSAEAAGFSKTQVDEIRLTVEARQRVDLTLTVGTVAETVTVEATNPLLETDSSSKGQIIGQQQIVGLPLQGRSYANLALLVPGVRQSQSGNSGDISFRREGSYNVNGLRSVFNNFLLDGVDNNFYGTTNQGFSNQAIQPSPDSVAEFRMSINAYTAEYGRTGGAVMNVSTRSGTNQFHGSAWEFLQNTKMNATGFFKPVDNRKPQSNRNQFGFTFGGPIFKDRTFFFADFEGGRWIQSPFALASLPSLAQRQGILPNDVQIPINYRDADGRQVTAGTVIPAGQPVMLTAFARRVLAELPAPNRPGGGVLGVGNNFGGFARNQLFDDKGAIKLDHTISSRLNSFFRYSQRRQDIEQPGLVTGFSGGNALGFLHTYNQQGIAGLTFTKSPTEVIEYRFSVTRLGMDRTPAQVGGQSMQDLFGISGLPTGDRIRGGVTPQDIVGFARIGRQSTNPQAQFPTTINSRLNLSKLVRKHSFKMGYELLQLNIRVDDTNPLYGIDGYGGFFSRPAGGTANTTVYSLADFYAGARAQYQLATQVQAKVRQQAHWWYFQDDFKVSDKLTLNLGLRYELTSPFYDADNKLANWNPATNQLEVTKGGNISERSLRNLDKNNFAPRIGAAYKINAKMVMRGGYGLGYNYWNRMASSELLSTNAPFVTRFSRQNSAANLGNFCGGNSFDNCFRTREQGYPTNLPSNVILYTQRDLPFGYIQNWHVSLQYNLLKNTLIDVAYVGNKGSILPLLGDINQARPITAAEQAQGLTTLGTLQARRPFAGFGNITSVLGTGFSNYNGLQMKFEQRGKDLQLLSSFTYSKAIDNVGQVLEGSNGGSPNPQDVRNPKNDRGASSFDQRFNSTTSFSYDVPFFKKNYLLGGWNVASIITLTSGQPLNLRYPDNDGRLSDNQADFLGGVALRPNLINPALGAKAPDAVRDFTNYFNRGNLRIPDPNSPFGNLGRNVVYGFPLYQVDFTVGKSFALTERFKLMFRSEFFNLLNKTNFSAPQVDITSAAFGRVSSTFDPRAVQLALKLSF